MSIECLTGYTGTANIGADDLIEIVKALLGGGNRVLSVENTLALTVAPAAGNVTVAAGALSFGGILGRVKSPETVSYTAPGSDSLYRKVWIGARYTCVSGVDSFELVALESEEKDSEAAAQSEALSEEIATELTYGQTAECFMPLWSFVCNASSAGIPEQLFEIASSFSTLAALVITAEKSTAKAQDGVEAYAKALNVYTAAKTAEIEALTTGVNSSVNEMSAYINALPASLYELADIVSKDGDNVKFNTGEWGSVSIGLYDSCPAVIFTTADGKSGCIYLSSSGNLMRKNNTGSASAI